MAKDFYQFIKKKDGVIKIEHIAKRFPNISKEEFLLGVGKWLDDKGMEHAEKLKALEAMDIWWKYHVENYRNTRKWYQSKKFLKGLE
ncbi:MAG: hypothetical protein Q8934_14245 [Bacillota bacterium]|nr:hypothetical protein [Bacillota bacterium]